MQGVRKFVCAANIVQCVSQDHLHSCLHHKKLISLCTAQQWMKVMVYWWQKEPKGQYINGHERDDVVEYQQKFYLPHSMEVMVYQYDKLFGYGCWMTSIGVL